MALFVEGIGGTGKAVVNLLRFAEHLSKLVERPAPDIPCAVIDQDNAGVWTGTSCQQPVSNRSGLFAPAYGITTREASSAALLLFSNTELGTDIGRGFHGQPKLAASLTGLWNSPQSARSDVHVLMYSDIGGTGAGLGPVRLNQLLADPQKTYVIAIVFGRYLDAGASNPTGYEWLKQLENSPDVAQPQRMLRFLGYYINVPIHSVNTGGTIPTSGLNPTPALLLAAAYVWRLAESIARNQLEEFTGANTRRTPAHVEVVGFHTPPFSHSQPADCLMSSLRGCAISGNLKPLLPPRKDYLNASIRQFVGSGLAAECWRVFAAADPVGPTSHLEVNYASSFRDTFTSVPEPWAAARWFHRAVRNGDSLCQDALRRMISLYFQDKLRVIKTKWSPDGSEMYALSLRPIPDGDPNYEQLFASNVVGAFSRKYPFWTVPTFLGNLQAATPNPSSLTADLLLERRSSCGAIYHSRFSIPQAPGEPLAVALATRESVEVPGWEWVLDVDAGDWAGLVRVVDEIELLRSNLEILEGSLSIGTRYRCTLRGLQFNSEMLAHDSIGLGGQNGLQLYDLLVSGEGLSAALVGSRLARQINDPKPLHVGVGPAAAMLGNVRVRFTR